MGVVHSTHTEDRGGSPQRRWAARREAGVTSHTPTRIRRVYCAVAAAVLPTACSTTWSM